MTNLEPRYYLREVNRIPDREEREVTREEFVRAERAAGFRNTLGRPDEPGTAGFSTDFMRGRVVYERRASVSLDRADKLFLTLKGMLDETDKRIAVEESTHNPNCHCEYFSGHRAAMNAMRVALQAAYSVPPPVSTVLPEELRGDGPCRNCGTVDNIIWRTDDAFWNEVIGGAGCRDDLGGLYCIPCLARIVFVFEAGYHPNGWRITPEWPWVRPVPAEIEED